MALVGALAIAVAASAVVTGQTMTVVAQKTKQSKKTRGPVGSFAVDLATTYNGFGPRSTQAVLTFDPDYLFNAGKLPQCNAASLTGKDAAGARAACPKSIEGQGHATLTQSNGATLPAVVTAFNGVKSGGNLTILLHTDVQGSSTKPILTGTLSGGHTLTVLVPLTPGIQITDFQVTINQLVTQKKRVHGKVVKTFFISAKCSRGTWNHTETTTYEGNVTQTHTASQKCKKTK
ncbi:MAG: hypothetical protein ACJ75Z_11205 [Solirubrobacterales bacterium]